MIKRLLMMTVLILGQLGSILAQDSTMVNARLEWHLTEVYNNKKLFTPKEYNKIRSDYNEIAYSVNSVFEDAAYKIKSGLTFTSEKNVFKKHKDLSDRLANLERKAELFEVRLERLLTEKTDNIYVGPSLTVAGIITVLVTIYNELSYKACENSKQFYNKMKWKTYDEIAKKEVAATNFSFLGKSCSK